jgi:NADH-quinone oxidoreductase subunit N
VPLAFTFFLLIFPKFIFSCFLFIFFNYIVQSNLFISNILLYVSLISIFANAFISLYQTKIKKLIILTSFANLPFFIMFIYLKTFNALISFFCFIIIYYFNIFALFTFLIFFSNLSFTHATFYKKLTSLMNIYRTNKTLAYILTSFFLSLAGIPPFSGFFAKFYFLASLVNSGNIFLFLFFSFLNLLIIFVYLRAIRLIFQFKKSYEFKPIYFNCSRLLFFFVLFFFFNITAIFYFDFLFNFIKFFLLSCE